MLPVTNARIGRWSLLTVAVSALCVVWLLGGWGGPATTQFVSEMAFATLGVFAALAAAQSARLAAGRRRTALLCLTAGLAGWVFADLYLAYHRLVLSVWVPFPSPADVGYIVLPAMVCLTLLLLPVRQPGQSSIRMVLDGVIVAGSVLLTAWVLVLRDLFAAADISAPAFAVSLAYPLLDLITVTVAILVLARARADQRAVITLLLAGIGFMAASNNVLFHVMANGGYTRGDRLDIGWVLALTCFALAAVAACRTPSAEPVAAEIPAGYSAWLPYIPLLLSGVVCTSFLIDADTALVMTLAVGLVIAVLARQFLVVAENRELLVQVSNQAVRDPLTGLANRILFHDRLAHAVGMRLRDPRPLAVLSLDLDHFKLVNDSLGHPAGDLLLRDAAERISLCVRSGDTVARLGGDEFAVLIEGGPEKPQAVAQCVVEAFDEPFLIDGFEVIVRPSVGLAIANGPDDSADALLKQADVAMYSAKRARTSAVHIFDPHMHLIDLEELGLPGAPNGVSRNADAAAMRLLGQLRRALERRELALVYQPKFDLRTGRIIGVEALVRWHHPDRGTLGPDHFLPLVRQNGLMEPLTGLVIDQALTDANIWRARGFTIPVAVNLAAPSLDDLDLPRRLTQLLASHDLPPELITVEITEDLVLSDIARTKLVLDQLRELGIRVSIDDFGSAYSALYYLRELPIDELKLDRLFVAPIVTRPRAAAIVKSVIELARTLGVTTVAEGVENSETALLLEQYGCDAAQGFHFSPPLDARAVMDLMSSSTTDGAATPDSAGSRRAGPAVADREPTPFG